jgi:peptidoglycan/LPS O-acetylase OafA/YrhL
VVRRADRRGRRGGRGGAVLAGAAAPTACILACLVGITWGVNVVEGGTVPFGASLAAGLAVYGWRTRSSGTGSLLALAFGVSLVLVAAYGVWQGGYPQPSQLGWL